MSKIKAVISFNNREAIRAKIGQILLLILMILWIIECGKEIFQTRTITIKNVQAKEVQAIQEIKEVKKELSIEEKIKNAFPDNYEIMIAIAKAESGMDPKKQPNGNKDGSIDTGIFRINSCHGYDVIYLSDVDNNIKVAKEIYKKQGLDAWVAYKNNSFKKFLK